MLGGSLLVAILLSVPAERLPEPIHFDPPTPKASKAAAKPTLAPDATALARTCPTGYHLECDSGCGILPCGKPRCYCVQDPPPTETGTMTPAFYILHVYYNAPGATSSVQYTSSTELGSTTDNTSSGKNGITVSSSIGVGLIGGSIDVEFGREWGSTRTDQVDVKTTQSNGYNKPSTGDFVDHDYDEIWFIATPSSTSTTPPRAPTDPRP